MTDTSPPGSCEGLSDVQDDETTRKLQAAEARLAALAQSRPSPPGPDAGELREAARALDQAADAVHDISGGTVAHQAMWKAQLRVRAALRTSEEGAGRG